MNAAMEIMMLAAREIHSIILNTLVTLGILALNCVILFILKKLIDLIISCKK